MFGSKLLVAPLFEEGDARSVYLPPGDWIDFQSGQTYLGGKWHTIAAGPVPIVALVRSGSAIPTAKVAQHTSDVDWENLELRVFSNREEPITGHVALPAGKVHDVKVSRGADGKFNLAENPFEGDVHWQVTNATGE
jgi:alpha-D-xyloside xylohydrolase